jgi:endonuclease/exonuclease/phosphatase family metal-dependent hydrolase
MTRSEMADAVDALDADIADLQEAKRNLFASYRADLEGTHDKDAVKAEIAALKAAIRRRQKAVADPENEQAVDLADEIFAEISAPAPRATHVREEAA